LSPELPYPTAIETNSVPVIAKTNTEEPLLERKVDGWLMALAMGNTIAGITEQPRWVRPGRTFFLAPSPQRAGP